MTPSVPLRKNEPKPNALAYIVSKAVRHFLAVTNVSVVSIGQVTAQKGQSKTMATELVAGASQFLFIPFNAQGSKQLRAKEAGCPPFRPDRGPVLWRNP
jgi:hypothetical protein